MKAKISYVMAKAMANGVIISVMKVMASSKRGVKQR
jgi:hypothetical protein